MGGRIIFGSALPAEKEQINLTLKPHVRAVFANGEFTPQRFFGMHFEPGLAEYQHSPDSEPERILLTEEVIKGMNPTFEGKPMFVEHVETEDVSDPEVQNKIVGYVVKSFFNPLDGKSWAEFLVTKPEGLKAIQEGHVLSNAYVPEEFGPGGVWHGMDYHKSVKKAVFVHLAFVRTPRYEASVIMTPEEFNEYRDSKESELRRVANSKNQKGATMFSWMKRQKIENDLAEQLESSCVILPKSKKEFTVEQLVNAADKVVLLNGYADGESMVKCGEDEMSVNDLVGKYLEMKEAKKNEAEGDKPDTKQKNMKKKSNEEAEGEELQENSDPEESESDIEEGHVGGKKEIGVENTEEEEFPEREGKQNEEDEEEDLERAMDKPTDKMPPKKKSNNSLSHYDRLSNAHIRGGDGSVLHVVETGWDRTQRGQERYG